MLEEIYYIARHLNFTRSDVLRMPIFERRFYLKMLSDEFEKKNKAIEQANQKARR
jgi:hypothetical protein|tara:strand:- start:10094 stop:10258 length:165 start_codon:yes stop_codon:yes gene_type:complete